MGAADTSRLRIGLGHDTHRLGPGGPLRLGGVDIPCEHSLIGHSDADVLLHAITDAILGAAGLPDIGQLFPNTEEENRHRDSGEMLRAARDKATESGWRIINLDCVLHLERPKFSPHKDDVRTRIAELLEIGKDVVGIKAKTGEGVGSVGRHEAVTAQCVVLLTN
ncbi:MAG: 2-C-methyl-D-erythritol 2,4-cyclodiphosphate synthase [Pirellulaceae bacterium]|jgi:2-C-methyl-D-erythritol 2,4-cyclodiphosphate synthase|nr:2-C-methyl-D-erythritol 2,4-cyclodiphosphate synthase [Pirellulaceae bacterium]MDP7018617.1 2-C-methyl-D-erythritol 2,4-cyclodiphosphate synthase [Pirellulaceae bacterium]